MAKDRPNHLDRMYQSLSDDGRRVVDYICEECWIVDRRSWRGTISGFSIAVGALGLAAGAILFGYASTYASISGKEAGREAAMAYLSTDEAGSIEQQLRHILSTSKGHAEQLRDTLGDLNDLLSQPVTVLGGVLHNLNYSGQGVKNAGYWRTEGKPWRSVPWNEEITIDASTRSLAILTATGNMQSKTSGQSIHLSFLDPVKEERLGTVSYYRHSGDDHDWKARFWNDNGGWAPFAFTTVVVLEPGPHTIGLGSYRELDGDWQFHHTQIQAVILPLTAPPPPNVETISHR